jgi:hypothetical protein
MLSRYLSVLVLFLVGCQTTSNPPSEVSNELQKEILLLSCEHAVFAEAGRYPERRDDFQNCLDILDFMLDEPILRQDLCQALLLMGVRDFIPPEGGRIVLSESDVLVNGRSISDEMIYPVANSFWVGLNKFLFPVALEDKGQ